MKILAFPYDANPYQALLYGEMRRRGAQVSYVGQLTPSYTFNLFLQPLELIIRRLGGARLLHLHWVHSFALLGSFRFPFLRQIAEAWFTVWLWVIRSLGIRLVWTAHNVLPSSVVFADDLRARKQLVAACDLVLVHSQSTLTQLAELGIVPRKSVVIPHGPFTVTVPQESLRTPGTGPSPRKLLFFGKVRKYKGVEDLLAAFAALSPDLDLHLIVAGECSDPSLATVIKEFARQSAGRVDARLEHISDDEISLLFADADAVILPFRQITTSGSAMLALCHGRPLVVPDLPGLAHLPDGPVIRYDGTVSGLIGALADITLVEPSVLSKMSADAYAYCSTLSWSKIAEATLDSLELLVNDY
jgi:glycosyltransferase involved in cell wall biosynthesis